MLAQGIRVPAGALVAYALDYSSAASDPRGVELSSTRSIASQWPHLQGASWAERRGQLSRSCAR